MSDRSRMAGEIRQYVRSLEEAGVTHRYICQTRATLFSFRGLCKEQGIQATSRVRPQHVLEFLKRYEGLSVSHQRTTASILRTFLAALENPSMLRMKLRLKGYSRVRVDWLTLEEVEQVFETPMTPQQAVLIGAGLLQGFRRVETLRLTVRDAQEALRTQNLRVRGKGGKERTIPLHPQFALILQRYLAWTELGPEDDSLLGFARTRSEQLLAEFCRRFGRWFTFHTMRRTFGRILWLKGVVIETISEILGHSSTDMTRRYLGLNLSDMRAALAKYQVPMIADSTVTLAP